MSCDYRLRPGALAGALAVLCAPTPDRPVGGALSLLEDDRCLVTLVGMVGAQPPTRPEQFLGFAERLPAKDLARALDEATPAGDPVRHRQPTSLRRRYDRLRRFAAGLTVLGDASAR